MRKLIVILLGIFILIPALTFAKGTDRYILKWTTVVTSANDAPESTTVNGTVNAIADYAIPVTGASHIGVTWSSAADDGCTNTATDWDLNFIVSNDNGVTFDTGTGTSLYHEETSLDDGLVSSIGLTPSGSHLKLRVDENAALEACITVWIRVTWDK